MQETEDGWGGLMVAKNEEKGAGRGEWDGVGDRGGGGGRGGSECSTSHPILTYTPPGHLLTTPPVAGRRSRRLQGGDNGCYFLQMVSDRRIGPLSPIH